MKIFALLALASFTTAFQSSRGVNTLSTEEPPAVDDTGDLAGELHAAHSRLAALAAVESQLQNELINADDQVSAATDEVVGEAKDEKKEEPKKDSKEVADLKKKSADLKLKMKKQVQACKDCEEAEKALIAKIDAANDAHEDAEKCASKLNKKETAVLDATKVFGTAKTAFAKKTGALECDELTYKADAGQFASSAAAVDALKTLAGAAKAKKKALTTAKTELESEKTAYGLCAQTAKKADGEIKDAKKARKAACKNIEALIPDSPPPSPPPKPKFRYQNRKLTAQRGVCDRWGYTGAYGGNGGGRVYSRCAEGAMITQMWIRSGALVDRIHVKCSDGRLLRACGGNGGRQHYMSSNRWGFHNIPVRTGGLVDKFMGLGGNGGRYHRLWDSNKQFVGINFRCGALVDRVQIQTCRRWKIML